MKDLFIEFYMYFRYIYKPRLWPGILSPNHRGIGMAAIPKKNGKNYCSFGSTLNAASLPNSLKSLKTSEKPIPSFLQESDKTHKS